MGRRQRRSLGKRRLHLREEGDERTVSIVGVDEIDTERGYISWISPMARALMKAREGDTVTLRTPGGVEELDVVAVKYEALDTDPTSVDDRDALSTPDADTSFTQGPA